MSFDDYIFVRPGFLRGMGKAIDIGGTLSREGVLTSATPGEADARALYGDFRAVGRAIGDAFTSLSGNAEKAAP